MTGKFQIILFAGLKIFVGLAINKTSAVLEDKLSIHDYKVIHGEEIQIFEHLGCVHRISKTLTDNGLVITRLNEEGQNLEDYYLEKAGGRNE